MRVEIIKDTKKDDQAIECNIVRIESGDNWYEISTTKDGVDIFTTHQIVVVPNSSNCVSINSQLHSFNSNAKSR